MEYLLKNGKSVTIRAPRVEDAEAIIELVKKADSETRFLAREAGEFKLTLKEERSIIISTLASLDRTWFVAEYEGKIVGQCSVGLIRQYYRYRHRAGVAFLIAEEYCNLGIGGKMMEECLSWCRSHSIEQVELDVVTSNSRALNMYRGFGFEVAGTIPKALHYKDGTYADEYFMIKRI